MNKPEYVYVTFIATTPEKVWQALTDPALMRQYWVGPKADCARMNVSDWKAGSRWVHERAEEPGVIDIAGKVVESTPPTKLVMTWARPVEEADASKHSRVTFDIDSYIDGLVKLTVTHEDFKNDMKMLEGVSSGWPAVLSNLKTLLETGRVLPRQPAAH